MTAQEPGRGFSYHWPGTMAESVLVVEDEVAIADAVAYALEGEGFEVDRAGDGEEALARARDKQYELIVLDLRLPKVNGIEVTRILRAESIVPILMLTAKDSEVDRVVGLEVGADDYVTKPFSMAELISRVRAILRRRQLDRLSGDPVRRVGGLRLDLVRHEVRVDDQNVRLTPSEFRLLTFLAEEPETRLLAPGDHAAPLAERVRRGRTCHRHARLQPAPEDRA